ncbi:hypothetical protein E8E13_004075 [Curvularia kusanoi]|uniref:Uncharacterized protein n=1 Tax=Curvularia kusanoi TaxID=90978 RepID=A0A9P4W5Z0_CURKU|nr:hypothetical protein E8E13_004075 [Curvularia kusanoi]
MMFIHLYLDLEIATSAGAMDTPVALGARRELVELPNIAYVNASSFEKLGAETIQLSTHHASSTIITCSVCPNLKVTTVDHGEDQHALTRKPRLGFSAAEPSLIDSPYRACLIATGVTAFLSVLGVARPGTFLRTVAVTGAIDGAITACDIYGRQELNRAVLKMDGLENPKPFKLWERTKQWTLEDASLFGGATGLLIASNPRLFPGARGFSRFFGITVAGCAIGAKTAEWALSRGPPHQAKRVEWVLAMQRRAHYERLSSDEKAKDSLSRFGKGLLMSYTKESTLMQILGKPFGGLSGAATPTSVVVEHGHAQDAQMASLRQHIQEAHANPPILMVAEFENEELAAPDYERGYRQYCMDPAETDLEEVQEHLEHLNKLHDSETKELAYVWQALVPKEHQMHQMSEAEPEKELLRRELQLLNSIAVHSQTRLAVIAYAQADARKRMAQIRDENVTAIAKIPLPGMQSIPLEEDWSKSYVPHKTAERIRSRWESARGDLAHIDAVLAQFERMKARGQVEGNQHSLVHKKAKELQTTREQVKLNVEATERVLKEFEDRVFKAEEQNSK